MRIVFMRTTGYIFHPRGEKDHLPCRRAYQRALGTNSPYTRYEYRVYDEGHGFPMIYVWIRFSMGPSINNYEVRSEVQRDDVPEAVRIALERVMETGVAE